MAWVAELAGVGVTVLARIALRAAAQVVAG